MRVQVPLPAPNNTGVNMKNTNNSKLIHLGIDNDEVCVMCGAYVPEGEMVCKDCRDAIENRHTAHHVITSTFK